MSESASNFLALDANAPLAIRIPPGPLLAPHVELLWYWKGPPEPHRRERLLPNGGASFVVNLGCDSFVVYDHADRPSTILGSVLCGPQSRYFAIDSDVQSHVAGVEFRPGGISAFSNAPASEFRDQQIRGQDLWRAAANELRDRMLQERTPRDRLRVLETFFTARLLRPSHTNRAVEYALQQFQCGAANISRVRDDVGMSPKRFIIAAFRNQTGMTPKLYSRIRRFQKLIRTLPAGKINWADEAARCGFFDQSHLVHEFQVFAGVPPSTYGRVRTEHINHLPLE